MKEKLRQTFSDLHSQNPECCRGNKT